MRWNVEPLKMQDSIAATDPVQRSAFILRVYSVVLLQLATTAVSATFFVVAVVPKDDEVFGSAGRRSKVWETMTSTPVYCTAVVLSFGLLCLLFAHRKDPLYSLQIFEAFALIEGYFIGISCTK